MKFLPNEWHNPDARSLTSVPVSPQANDSYPPYSLGNGKQDASGLTAILDRAPVRFDLKAACQGANYTAID